MDIPTINTKFIGKFIKYYEKISSTNDIAIELLQSDNVNEGTLVIAKSQTSGRGQRGTKWFSSDKSLTLSLILKPDFLSPNNHFLLTIAISLAVQKSISSFTTQLVTIKWPNDIYIEDEKVAGILIQTSLQGEFFKSAIVGLGINLNNDFFPDDLPNPTSIFLEEKIDISLDSFLPALCQNIEEFYEALKASDYSRLRRSYIEHLYKLRQNSIYFTDDGKTIQGKIIGVSDSGLLQIEDSNGDISDYDFKKIQYDIN